MSETAKPTARAARPAAIVRVVPTEAETWQRITALQRAEAERRAAAGHSAIRIPHSEIP